MEGVDSRAASPLQEEQVKEGLKHSVSTKIEETFYLATEGPLLLRILSFLSGVGMVVTSVMDWIGDIFTLHAIYAVISVYTFIFGAFICALEGRFLKRPQNQLATRIRKATFAQAGFLKYVWGRGCFLIFSGVLQLSLMRRRDMISGLSAIVVGSVSIVVGRTLAQRLAKLQKFLEDENHLRRVFRKYLKRSDGMLQLTEFCGLLRGLGIKLSDAELEAIFTLIDQDDDGKISADEFHVWWASFDDVDGFSDGAIFDLKCDILGA